MTTQFLGMIGQRAAPRMCTFQFFKGEGGHERWGQFGLGEGARWSVSCS